MPRGKLNLKIPRPTENGGLLPYGVHAESKSALRPRWFHELMETDLDESVRPNIYGKALRAIIKQLSNEQRTELWNSLGQLSQGRANNALEFLNGVTLAVKYARSYRKNGYKLSVLLSWSELLSIRTNEGHLQRTEALLHAAVTDKRKKGGDATRNLAIRLLGVFAHHVFDSPAYLPIELIANTRTFRLRTSATSRPSATVDRRQVRTLLKPIVQSRQQLRTASNNRAHL